MVSSATTLYLQSHFLYTVIGLATNSRLLLSLGAEGGRGECDKASYVKDKNTLIVKSVMSLHLIRDRISYLYVYSKMKTTLPVPGILTCCNASSASPRNGCQQTGAGYLVHLAGAQNHGTCTL